MIELEVALEFKPLDLRIYEIYKKFGYDFRTILYRIAIDAVSMTATNYTATDFF
jgi:hypothetical protein